MLIEFRLKNFRSILDTQVLSMVAGPGSELPQNMCSADFDANIHLVKAAVIYGPNAGGKSNLILALSFMRWLILSSANESQQGEKIPVEGFLFNKQSPEQSSEFEIIFSKEKVRYQYGFTLNQNKIIEEWLISYPEGRSQHWFARKYNEKSSKYLRKFSKYFKGKKQTWASATRNNALFLSTAIQLNNEQLKPIFTWFQKDLIVVSPSRGLNIEVKSFEQIKTIEGRRKIMKYINIADPSITDISLETEKFSEEFLPKNMPKEFKDIVTKNFADREFAKIDFIHENGIKLNISNESDGTNKFLSYACIWEDVLENARVVVVDELDSSLHPLAVKFLLNLIYNNEENKENSQLIFTTHNTSFLDNDTFRRDQVWFIEKDKKNSTQLYPLLDFSPRKNESISKGYLQGRYGALPYIGDWRF
jgi:uncharacterized protein